jgi:hypothetical protein
VLSRCFSCILLTYLGCAYYKLCLLTKKKKKKKSFLLVKYSKREITTMLQTRDNNHVFLCFDSKKFFYVKCFVGVNIWEVLSMVFIEENCLANFLVISISKKQILNVFIL